jgi:ribonuclease VapC
MKVVLDASAVLAVLQGENGQDVVLPHLQGGIISAVNYSEILKKSAEHGSELERTRHFLATFSLIVTPFDEQQAVAAARLWPMSRQLGLSFADRACLALGESLSAEVLTADTRMGMAELPVIVKVIR